MVLYIVKSFICLLFLVSFYKFFLERENMHHFKRIFLLGSLVFAVLIPFTKMKFTKQKTAKTPIEAVGLKTNATLIPQSNITDYINTYSIATENFTKESLNTKSNQIHWLFISFILIYSIGMLFFLFRFMVNLNKIFFQVKNNSIIKTKTHIKVLLKENIPPHSFFNYIFLNKQAYQLNEIAPEVLLHEQAHITQKHSLDILFVELLQILFWFNPLFLILKKSIKLNHEFLADQKVLKQKCSITKYQNILLNFASTNYKSILSSNINYLLTKKRLKMMTKQTSRLTAIVWKLTLIPLGIALVFLLSTKVKGQQNSLNNKKSETITSLPKKIFKKETPIKTIQTKNTTVIPEVHKEKISVIKHQKKKNEVTQLKLLVKEHNKQLANNKGINPKNVKKLKFINGLITTSKKKAVTGLPDVKTKVLLTPNLMSDKIQEPKAPEPIKVENSTRIPALIKSKIDTSNYKIGKILINNQILYYSVIKGKTRYYNRWGKRVDKNGKIIIGNRIGLGILFNFTIYAKKNGVIRYFGLFGLELDKRGEILEPQPVLSSSDVSPYEYIRIMNSRNAKFYLDKKLIAKRKIYRILKKKKRVTVLTKIADLKNPVVNLASY